MRHVLGVARETVVHLCPEHADKAPRTWPGEFLAVGFEEKAKANLEKAMAEGRIVDHSKRDRAEAQFPFNQVVIDDGSIDFRPRFIDSQAKNTDLAFVYSHPGSPSLDEGKLKQIAIRVRNHQEWKKGVNLSRNGADATVLGYVSDLVDGKRLTLVLDELMSLRQPVAGRKVDQLKMSVAIGEFKEEDTNQFRLLRFLTPVCEGTIPPPE